MAGKTVYSCSVLAIDAQGKNIETIEGLAAGNNLHPISAASSTMTRSSGGYCTSGFVMAAKASIDKHPNPTWRNQARAGW